MNSRIAAGGCWLLILLLSGVSLADGRKSVLVIESYHAVESHER